MQFKEVFLAENFFGVTKSGNGAGNVRGYRPSETGRRRLESNRFERLSFILKFCI